MTDLPFPETLARMMADRNKTSYAVARDSEGGITRSAIDRLLAGLRRDPSDQSLDALVIGLELGPLQRIELYVSAGRVPYELIAPSLTGISIIAENTISKEHQYQRFVETLYESLTKIEQAKGRLSAKRMMDLIAREFPEMKQ